MRLDELHQLPGHLIRRVHQISGALFAVNFEGYGLTSVQYAALVAIGSNPGVDATRLSDLIAFDKATLGGVIDRLEAKDFVSRRPSKQDRRIKTVTLTAAGKAILAQVEVLVLKTQNDILEPLSESQRQHFIKLLKKVAVSRS